MNGMPLFVGVNEKFLNLNSIALVEDKSPSEDEPVAVITTNEGTEIELVGDDADIVFERIAMFESATNELIARIMAAASSTEVES